MSNVLFSLARPRGPGTPSATEGHLDSVSPQTAMSATSGYAPRDTASAGAAHSTGGGNELVPPQRPLSAPMHDRPHRRDYPAPLSVISAHSAPVGIASSGSGSTPWSRGGDDGGAGGGGVMQPPPHDGGMHLIPDGACGPVGNNGAPGGGVGGGVGVGGVGVGGLDPPSHGNGFPSHFPRSDSPSTMSDDDALEAAMVGEPFRHFTKREEELHFMAQGEGTGSSKHPREGSNGGWNPKRRRTDGTAERGEEWCPSPIREKGDLGRHSSDPITLGYLTEDDGRRLFSAFFKYAHPFVPIFDPREDTFEK